MRWLAFVVISVAPLSVWSAEAFAKQCADRQVTAVGEHKDKYEASRTAVRVWERRAASEFGRAYADFDNAKYASNNGEYVGTYPRGKSRFVAAGVPCKS